jgi:hypothetical protein
MAVIFTPLGRYHTYTQNVRSAFIIRGINRHYKKKQQQQQQQQTVRYK